MNKWVEVKALKFFRDGNVTKFLYKDIFTRYGVPKEIVANQGLQFTSKIISKLVKEYEIRHRDSKNYHPETIGRWRLQIERLIF